MQRRIEVLPIGDNFPAIPVLYPEAQEFCEKLNFRLPSETEWEYACRAGSNQKYFWGDEEWGSEMMSDYAWYFNNIHNNSRHQIQEVGQLKPNAFGLYDMLGNIEEWCSDSFCDEYSSYITDNSYFLQENNGYRVVRGGNYLSIANDCCCHTRDYKKWEIDHSVYADYEYYVDSARYNVCYLHCAWGFRVVADIN